MPAKAKKKLDYALPSLEGSADIGKDLVNWLFPAYVTMIVLSIFTFLLKSSMTPGHEMSFDRAVLTAVNAATLTGFQQSTLSPNSFKPQGQFLVLFLTVAGSLFSLIVGGLAVTRILRLRFTDRQVIWAACICEAGALLIGASGVCGMSQQGPTSSILTGPSQGASAFGNSGMALGYPFGILNWQTHFFIIPMILLGGFGITVLMELYDLLLHARPLSTHARTVLTWSACVYLIGTVALIALRWLAAHAAETPVSGETLVSWLASSSIASINSRTAGVPFEMAHAYARVIPWAIIILMMIGAGSGGTAGGLKVTTLAVLCRGARRSLAGENPGRPFGIALSWLALYLGIALVGFIMLLLIAPELAADRVLFLTISALSNVGLSHDPLPNLSKGAYVLAALMLAGRMVPLLILWWMADSTRDAEIAVG
jgi:Trk-type K+ transport system membrane component